jgi:hypothetical protein
MEVLSMNTEDSQGRIAGPLTQEDRTTFLTEPMWGGSGHWHHASIAKAQVGLHNYYKRMGQNDCQLTFRAGPCDFTIYPTPEELRLMARAFNLAADHAEELHRQSQQVAA